MFFDNASTTKIDDKIISRLKEINDEFFYNPGGLYRAGKKSRDFLASSRDRLKECLGCDDGNIIFCGSATECNNLAIMGSIKKNTRKILMSAGEHPSVYNVGLELKNKGYSVEFIPLNELGSVDVDKFKELMTPDVDFVSIMHVSNETGAINNIGELVEYAKDINNKVIFHCDGVQAFGKIDVDVSLLGVDMYTISAHKIHGCKGVGALYVAPHIKLKPVIYGGGQEGGLRSGTENILGIYTLVEAASIATENLTNNLKHIALLKECFLEELNNAGIDYVLHSFKDNSPYIVSISFMGCRAETLLHMLDDVGVMVGNGSACSSKNSGNRILENMGVSRKEIESNLRISFSKYNTKEDVVSLVQKLKEVVSEYLSKVSI